jgi:ribonucleoside-triphosphate reductase
MNLKVKDLPFVIGQGLMVGSEKLKPNDSIEPVMKNGS